jgi:hypothetical protein
MGTSLYTACAQRVLEIAQEALAEAERPIGRISIGGKSAVLPSEVLVRELPGNVEVSDPVTSRVMGRSACAPLAVEFSVAVEMWSVRAQLADAAADVALWWELVADAVSRDRTLSGLAIHVTPYYSKGGTATRDSQFIAAIDGGVRCKADLPPHNKEEDHGN